MSSRDNPFREIERMFNEMADRFGTPTGFRGGVSFDSGETMNVDVADHGDAFVVTADVPGFDRDEIDVRVANATLRIQAERERKTEQSDENYLRRERSRRSLNRSIRLPGSVDEEAASAQYQNGVLTVTLPKTDPSEGGRRVSVE